MRKRIDAWALYINLFLFAAIVFFSFFSTTGLFSVAGRSFQLSFYFGIVGLAVFYISYFFVFKSRSVDFLFPILICLFAILLTSSLGMAFALKPRFDGLFGSTPEREVIFNAAKYAFDLAFIPYFAFMVSILDRKKITLSVNIFLIAWIAFGLFQILVFYIDKESLWRVYDGLDVLKIIGGNSEMFLRIKNNYAGQFRFFGFASEPASNCLLVSVFLLPYLFYQTTRKGIPFKKKAFYFLALAFVLLLAFLTRSASVYAGIAVDLIGLFVVSIRKKTIGPKTMAFIAGGLLVGMAILLAVPKTRDAILGGFLLKIIDRTNHSTQHRYSTIVNDFMILLKNPLFGVGDGNQGYFYAENIAGTWMSRNEETQSAIQGKMGLLNGGAAIPSFISGFGLLGSWLIVKAYLRYLRQAANINPRWMRIRPYFWTGIASALFLASATAGIHQNYLLLLILCYPSLLSLERETNRETLSTVTFDRRWDALKTELSL